MILAVNALGASAYLASHADRLLAAAIDPLDADWMLMQRGFSAYAVYALSFAAAAGMAVAATAGWLGRRTRRGGSTVARRRLTYAALALALAGALVLLLVDVLVFEDYGVHFYDFNVFTMLADAALRRDLGIQPAQVARVTAAALALVGAELLLCVGAAHAARWRSGALARACAVGIIAAIPLSLALMRSAEAGMSGDRAGFEDVLPLSHVLLLRAGSGPHVAAVPRLGPDGYAILSRADSAPVLRRRPDIVFFVPDGLRSDMVSPQLTPNLWQFSQGEDVITSHRHYSTGHVSEAGIFGLTYAIDSRAFNAFLSHRVPSFPLELLHRNGYRTLLLASSRLNPFPTDQLVRGFDETVYPRDDDDAVAILRRFVAERRRDGVPYFVLAFFYTPHYPFTSAKPAFRRFPMVGPSARTNYMNDVLQADDYFRQTLDIVRGGAGADRTIVLATSDHGEEIRDHGVFGHAPATFWNEKVLVPFALRLPGVVIPDSNRRVERSSHVDVWPTILDYIGTEPTLAAASFSDGASLLRAQHARPITVYGRFFPEADRPSALVAGGRKYWFRVHGVAAAGKLCFDVVKVTDLNDRELPAFAIDAATTASFGSLQGEFWHFIRQPLAREARPANCTALAASFHGAGDGTGNRLSQGASEQRGRSASGISAGPGGPRGAGR